MKSREWLMLLYLGAFVAAMEVALEQFLSPLPMSLTWLVRSIQLGSMAVAALSLWNLLRQRVPHAQADEEFITIILDATNRTQEYIRDAFAHTLGALLVLIVAFTYAALLYVRLFMHTPSAPYYFTVMSASFLLLTLAWAVPALRIRRELNRIRHLPDGS